MSRKSQNKKKKGFLATLGAIVSELIEGVVDAVEVLEDF